MVRKGLQSIYDVDSKPESRIQAIFSCLRSINNETFQSLNFCLQNDPNAIVRHEAAYILGELHDTRSVPILKNAIESDSNKFVVHEAALALANLGNLGYPESENIFQKLLEYPDPDVVDTAEICLQRLAMKIHNKTLNTDTSVAIQDISNENKEVRIQASFGLMERSDEQSIDVLINALHREPSGIVKHEIIFSLGECISYKVVPELLNVLSYDKNEFVIHETLLALATIGQESIETTIKEFVTHANRNISETAKIALDRLHS